jgi:hypothetical protein
VKLLTDGSEKYPILGFCYAVIARHSENWPPTEEVLAKEFVNWFGVNTFLTRDALRELCLSKGVSLSFLPLPQELRGFNCSFEDKKEIVLSHHETAPFSHLHTLFHEFREMLEHVFAGLGYATVGPEDFLEVQAEHFATVARMEAAARELPVFFEMATSIEQKWARYFGYALLAVISAVYLMSCVLLPQMEEIASEAKRQRYVRT